MDGRIIKQSHLNRSKNQDLYLLLVPAVMLLTVFVIYPLISGIQISLTDWNGYSAQYNYVGWKNYTKLLTDKSLRTALVNTLIYGFGSAALQVGLGFFYALLLQKKFLLQTPTRTIIYLPIMVAQLLMGYIMYFILQYDNGALNDIVMLFGAEPMDWLAVGKRAVLLITLVNSFQFAGRPMIIFLAGMQNIPASYYEAAELDGAGWWQTVKSITVPMLAPAFITNITLNLIGSLKLYGLIISLSGGGPGGASHSLSTYINYTYFSNQDAGYAAAVGLLTFVIIALISMVMRRALPMEGEN